ncbi:MAG: DUF2868 domain-containing protein [Pseudomonadota bacterium]
MKLAHDLGAHDAGLKWAGSSNDIDSLELPGVNRTETRVLLRAEALAAELGIDVQLQQTRRVMRSTLLILTGLLCIAGISSAFAVLGDSTINVVWALGGLLGVHVVMLIVWIMTLAVARENAGGMFGRLWLYLSGKLAAPQKQAVLSSYIDLNIQTGLTPWLLSCLTHVLWAALLFGALLGLLIALSVKSYVFVWETTILSPQVFVDMIRYLAWLPAQLGFTVPTEEIVRGSALISVNSETTTQQMSLESAYRQAWSSWLIGCLLLYGVLPRLGLALFCFAKLTIAQGKVRLELGSAAWSAIAARLVPSSAHGGVRDPDARGRNNVLFTSDPKAGAPAVVLGLEVPAGISWLQVLPSGVRIISPVENRDQRRNARLTLQQLPPRSLLILCNAALSPDRGSLEWMAMLSAFAADTRVCLLEADSHGERAKAWRDGLETMGLPARQITEDERLAQNWLMEVAA